ncbi:winged helix-turn-helix domain-containing protein [Kribbella flavida]|uniref:winged helix-turn-helix domain-containing protein n=1 Tax=Kribbella flavida TaxID=182640 RepID=UPI0011D1B0F1|nr:helix-turn-helix domain-containing protein [Kribbella flavida]
MTSLTAILVDAVGGPRQGVPRAWMTALRRALPGQAVAAVAAQFEHGLLPDCLTPMSAGPIDEQLQRIAGLRPFELVDSIAEILPDSPPASWNSALRNPARWLANYATVLTAAWRVYRPIWAASTQLREREIERIGRASVTGSLDVALSALARRTTYTGNGVLHLPDSHPYQSHLADRPLLLVPLVAGTRASIFNLDDPTQAWIGYPVPGVHQNTPAPPPGDVLTLVLGPIRATLLRGLTAPMTMGHLARLAALSPSQATYHCTQLAEAGLLERRRTGQSVQVHRTSRGEAVLNLLT